MYALPKSEPKRTQWLDFIFKSIPAALPNIFLCPRHFTDRCFSNLGLFSAGFSKLLALKEDAVPTLCGPLGEEDVDVHVSKHFVVFTHNMLLHYFNVNFDRYFIVASWPSYSEPH